MALDQTNRYVNLDLDEEKLIAEGFTRLACLDINRKPTAIPEKVRNALT